MILEVLVLVLEKYVSSYGYWYLNAEKSTIGVSIGIGKFITLHIGVGIGIGKY